VKKTKGVYEWETSQRQLERKCSALLPINQGKRNRTVTMETGTGGQEEVNAGVPTFELAPTMVTWIGPPVEQRTPTGPQSGHQRLDNDHETGRAEGSLENIRAR
jgi:hypothetical protein